MKLKKKDKKKIAQKISSVICKTLKPKELLKIGNRSYTKRFKDSDEINKIILRHLKQNLPIRMSEISKEGMIIEDLIRHSDKILAYVNVPSSLIFKKGAYIYDKNWDGRLKREIDASAVIQSAINALATTGGKIFIKTGVYDLKNELVVNKDKLALEGEAKGEVEFRVYNTGLSLELPAGKTSLEEVTISNLIFKGGGPAGETATGSGITTENIPTGWNYVDRLLVENCVIRDFPATGQFCAFFKNLETSVVRFNKFINSPILLKFICNGYPAGNVRLIHNSFSPYGADRTALEVEAVTEDYVALTSIDNHFFSSPGLRPIAMKGIRLKATGGNIVKFQSYMDRFEEITSAIELVESVAPHSVMHSEVHGAYITNWTVNNVTLVKIGHRNYNNTIAHSHFFVDPAKTLIVGIDDDMTWANATRILFNTFRNFATGQAILPTTTTIIKGNWGYVTENSGTATIAAGTTSVVVDHGLAATPKIVKHCPRANLGVVWVSNRTSTQITLNVGTAPTADTITDWQAEI